MRERIKFWGLLLLIVLIPVMAITIYMQRDALMEKSNLLSALDAELITWKDRDGLNRAKIETIKTTKTKDFLKLETQDSIILELQKTVKDFRRYLKNGGNVTNVTNVTEVYNHEGTILTMDSTTSTPIYTSNHNLDGWVIGKVVASHDSTKLDLKIKNEYSIIFSFFNSICFVFLDWQEIINKSETIRYFIVFVILVLTTVYKQWSIYRHCIYLVNLHAKVLPFRMISKRLCMFLV